MCHGTRRHFGFQREVVHPLDDGGQLVDPVLHRRAREHQPKRRIELLHREGRLGRPVLDALGLVEHDEVRVPLAHDVHVAEELFVVGHEKPPAARVEGGASLGGVAVDHGGRRVGEQLPLAQPLGFERGGDDQQAAADAARVPERVAGGDRLRGLAEAHVVGEEKPPTGEEPLDAVALIRIEPLLERPQRRREAPEIPSAPTRARDAPAVFGKQSVQRGFAAAVPERAKEGVHQLQPPLRTPRDIEGEAAGLRATQPSLEGRGWRAIDPVDLREPVARARERTDGVPAQRRAALDAFSLGLFEDTRLGADVLQHGQQVLAETERAAEKIGAVAVALDRVDATEHRAIGPRGRAFAPGRVRTEEPAPARPGHDLEPVGFAERDPAQQRLERFTTDRPVGLGGDREDVADQQRWWHGPGLPMGPRQQHLMRLIIDGREDEGRW